MENNNDNDKDNDNDNDNINNRTAVDHCTMYRPYHLQQSLLLYGFIRNLLLYLHMFTSR